MPADRGEGGKTGDSATNSDYSPRNPRERGGGGAPAREAILSKLEDAIDEAHRKVTVGRVRDAENEKVRQQWIKTLSYAATSYRQLLRDQDLDDLRARIERLEERQAGESEGEGGGEDELVIDADEWREYESEGEDS